MKKFFIGVGAAIIGLVFVGIISGLNGNTESNNNSFINPTIKNKTQKESKENWQEILFDIGQWNKNNGGTTTQEFTITSDKWRVKWGKRNTTQLLIEVFTSNDELYEDPFTAELKEKEGILNFEGRGTYYIRMVGGTNPSASVWDIRVEQLKES